MVNTAGEEKLPIHNFAIFFNWTSDMRPISCFKNTVSGLSIVSGRFSSMLSSNKSIVFSAALS